MRSTALLALVLVLVGIAAPAFVAATSGSPVDSVAVDDAPAVELRPHPGPNGEYAAIEDGELALDLTAVAGERTLVHDVFTINATESATVNVTSEESGVAFYRGDDPNASLTEPVDLDPGERVDVGVEIRRAEAVRNGTFTVAVRAEGSSPPAPGGSGGGGGGQQVAGGGDGGGREYENVTVVEASAVPERVVAGQPVTVSASVENRGPYVQRERLPLTVDGVEVAGTRVVMEPNGEETATVEYTFEEPGEYDLALDGVDAGTVVVTEASGAAGEVTVTAASLDRETVAAGESVAVTATVESDGSGTAEGTVPLYVNGIAVDRQRVTVADEPETVTFERTFQLAGEYDVAVGEAAAGTVRVAAAGNDSPAFEVADATVSASEVGVGDRIAVTATVVNRGSERETFTAELAVGGVVVETVAVPIGPGETETVTFTRAFARPGSYALSVNGVAAGETGRVRVERGFRSSIAEFEPDTTGVVAALVAPAAGAGLLARRRL